MERREFIKYGACGLTTLALGNADLPLMPMDRAEAANLTFNVSMEEAMVEMVDGTLVYFWLFQLQGTPTPSIPGPVLFAVTGDRITLNVTNNLDEVHGFRITAAGANGRNINTGPINPGQTRTVTFTAPAGGTYMYLDPFNAPVNRVLGLHGAFIVLPQGALAGNAVTPYTFPTPNVQRLFNDLGGPLFPGEPWVPVRPAGAPIPEVFQEALSKQILTPTELARLAALEPFLYRTRVWVFNTVDPTLNAIAQAGGNAQPGGGIDPATLRANYLPRYFLVNGKSGAYASMPETAPETMLAAYIGEPHVVRILNAGLSIFSPHLHANHFYLTAVNNVVMESVTHPDTITSGVVEDDILPANLRLDRLSESDRLFLNGGSRMDWVVPYIRPPDIPGPRRQPLVNLIPQELSTVLITPQSPLKYPMHSHVELEETAAGGNYPQGLITDVYFLGEIINGVKVPFPKPPV